MSESVTITKVFRDQKETKFGPRVQTTIYTQEYPDVRISSFSKGLEAWNIGDKVMVEITKNGNFTNFKPADSATSLEARVKKLEASVFGAQETAKEPDVQTQEEFDEF